MSNCLSEACAFPWHLILNVELHTVVLVVGAVKTCSRSGPSPARPELFDGAAKASAKCVTVSDHVGYSFGKPLGSSWTTRSSCSSKFRNNSSGPETVRWRYLASASHDESCQLDYLYKRQCCAWSSQQASVLWHLPSCVRHDGRVICHSWFHTSRTYIFEKKPNTLFVYIYDTPDSSHASCRFLAPLLRKTGKDLTLLFGLPTGKWSRFLRQPWASFDVIWSLCPCSW